MVWNIPRCPLDVLRGIDLFLDDKIPPHVGFSFASPLRSPPFRLDQEALREPHHASSHSRGHR